MKLIIIGLILNLAFTHSLFSQTQEVYQILNLHEKSKGAEGLVFFIEKSKEKKNDYRLIIYSTKTRFTQIKLSIMKDNFIILDKFEINQLLNKNTLIIKNITIPQKINTDINLNIFSKDEAPVMTINIINLIKK